jgi:hypothetical protein
MPKSTSRAGSLVVLALLGCSEEPTGTRRDPERETIHVARSGGQTGMEGACLRLPEPKPFSAKEVRALLAGIRTTTMAYRTAQGVPGATTSDAVPLPLTVIVELEGDAEVVDPALDEGCQLRVRQDVVVTLRLDEPPLDIVIESTAYAFSGTFAVVQLELEPSVATALGLPAAQAAFSLAFELDRIEGVIEQPVGCGFAVYPADARCPDWTALEVALDRERDGFRPRDALASFDEFVDVPLRWRGSDATTTVTLTLTEEPAWACSSAWYESYDPERLVLPVSVRAVTADGSIDIEVPAEFEVDVTTALSTSQVSGPAGVIQSAGVLIDAVLAPGFLGPELWPADQGDAMLSLNVWSRPEGAHAEGHVNVVEAYALDLGPPLDATVADGDVSCFTSPAVGYPESVDFGRRRPRGLRP